MTSTSPVIGAWAARPVGKVARVVLATSGMIMATLVLMTASTVSSGSWALVLLGVGIAAFSVRAAMVPTATRLLLVAAALTAGPTSLLIL